MNVAYTGDPIKTLQTGELFLIKASQEECHRACLAHKDCQFYAWYDPRSSLNPEKCFLRKNKKEVVKEDYLKYGSKTCQGSRENALDTFFGACNGGRDVFNLEHVEALTTAIEADDLFHAGLYKESKDAVHNIWEKYPPGSNVWSDHIFSQAGKNGEWRWADPYALLRMVDDMASFKLTGNVTVSPQNQLVITVLLAKTKITLPRSWQDFHLENGTLKTNAGVTKVVEFYDKTFENNYKIIHENLKTWVAYNENALFQGKVDVQVEVIEVDEPMNCNLRYLLVILEIIYNFSFVVRLKEPEKIGELTWQCNFDRVLWNLPNDVVANSQWYILMFPHYAKELVGFKDFQNFYPHCMSFSGFAFAKTRSTNAPLFFMCEDNWIGAWIDNLSGGFR